MPVAKQKLIVLESVDSTNNYAMGLLQNNVAKNGNAIFAFEQTAGKGTRGKQWISEKGDNIILSVIVQMQWLPVQQQFKLSITAALAALEFFLKYINENVKIKWPNDIFINDRKAGGILIENIIKGNVWQWAVIGIGLNVNQIKFENVKATSLKKETGKSYDVLNLSKELHKIVLEKINSLQSGNFHELFEEYNKNLFSLNKPVRIKKENIVFETIIKEVSAVGQLITEDIIKREFSLGEIEWIIE